MFSEYNDDGDDSQQDDFESREKQKRHNFILKEFKRRNGVSVSKSMVVRLWFTVFKVVWFGVLRNTIQLQGKRDESLKSNCIKLIWYACMCGMSIRWSVLI